MNTANSALRLGGRSLLVDAEVLAILRRRADPEIGPSIIERVPIDMIDLPKVGTTEPHNGPMKRYVSVSTLTVTLAVINASEHVAAFALEPRAALDKV